MTAAPCRSPTSRPTFALRFVSGARPSLFPSAATAREATQLGDCASGAVVATALALARAFLAVGVGSPEPPRRMAALIASRGAAPIAAAAGLSVTPPELRSTSKVPSPIGFMSIGGAAFFGAGVPFGRLTAAMLDSAAETAEIFGDGEIRLTPWRALILPRVDAASEAMLQRHFAAAGFIVAPDDARLAVAACGGLSACEKATTQTRADALALAPIARRLQRAGIALHVSGCAKGCANPRPTPFTLVGSEGRYDLVVDGTAFDQSIAQNLDAAGAAQLLAAMASGNEEDRRRTPMTAEQPGRFDYLRDGAEIYRRSFATIRAEADLARFTKAEEIVAVRMIHACGMVEIAADIVFSPGAAELARRALLDGAPILCDSRMVAEGVTRARLPQHNEVICTLGDPAVAALAKEIGDTRSAAAVELWSGRIAGAVVAIGNAPTALFRLLDMLERMPARPACIIGMPVGFVGAAESKEALMARAPAPFITVRGRKGGSAMTAAALNALAGEAE